MTKKKGFVTIGHGTTEIQLFIRTLIRYKVNCIVDVRSTPYSRRSPQYNREVFMQQLAKHNISYKWMGNELGGRPNNDTVFDEKGIVDYEKLVKTKLFSDGIKVLEEMCLTHNIAIMCSEENPMTCHRFLAVSRELARKEFILVHIKDFNNYVKQAQLEDEMVKVHFGYDVQLDFFKEQDDSLAIAYTKQNKACGYRRKVK